MSNQKTKMIDGVLYYAQRPKNCRRCVFCKNRKVGCTLGKENCYYLAEVVKTPQEKKCEGCCYTKGEPCVSATCYKGLDAWLRERQAGQAQAAPSLSQAMRMKKHSQESGLKLEDACEIMDELKKGDLERVTFRNETLRKYFPRSYTTQQMQDTIIRLLEQWQRRKQREQGR